jgi:hypothetical protein
MNYNFDFDEDNSWLDVEFADQPKTVPARGRAKTATKEAQWCLSAEYRAKLSAAGKGRKFTPEWRAKISAAHKGLKPSAETRAKISARQIATGKRPPDATGRKRSKQTRDNLKQAQQDRWHSNDPKWVAWRVVELKRRADRSVARQAARCADRMVKVYVTPFGEFNSRNDAQKYLQLAGVPNFYHWLANQQQQHPKKYYFTREKISK